MLSVIWFVIMALLNNIELKVKSEMRDPITSIFQSQCINIKDLSRQCY